MKACTVGAEKLQDAASLCRYCRHHLLVADPIKTGILSGEASNSHSQNVPTMRPGSFSTFLLLTAVSVLLALTFAIAASYWTTNYFRGETPVWGGRERALVVAGGPAQGDLIPARPSQVQPPNDSMADEPAADALNRITQANWLHHPKIQTVRDIVQGVNVAIDRRTLRTSERHFDSSELRWARIAIDSIGVVRRYDTGSASEDSSLSFQHYYDEAGRLRFVFIQGTASNVGSELEHRIYFDENGERIWEDHRITKGLGYSWPEIWPDEDLQKSGATEAFADERSARHDAKGTTSAPAQR